MEIKGKVVIVTGASAGIGEALVKELSKEGAKVVLAARSKDKLDVLAKDMADSLTIVADMRKPEDIKNLVNKTIEKYGRVDILINNAGQGLYCAVEDINIEQYKEVMELNVFSVVRAMQAVIPFMRKQGGGFILNISSRVSQNYYPNLAAYASTKYALNAISLTARAELATDKIIVSVFHPKMTATKFGENSMGSRPDWSKRPGPAPVIDTAEQVAEKVIEQLKSEQPEAGM